MPNEPFYQTKAWKLIRKKILARDHYLCQRCKRRPASMVHHIKALKQYPELALEPENLISLCDKCHEACHPERHQKKDAPKKHSGVRIVQI